MARMRIFAGPNGSGKTTINDHVRAEVNVGIYLNPDVMLEQIVRDHRLDVKQFGVVADEQVWAGFASNHGLYPLVSDSRLPSCQATSFIFTQTPNAYLVSIVADYIRTLLLTANVTFSLETVFSHSSKLRMIEEANSKNYRTYLYFVCTSDPEINFCRVRQRVLEGGHEVPEDKVRERYYRSLQNLKRAIELSYRSYLFDNSSSQAYLAAEVTPAKEFICKSDRLPSWVNDYVVNA